MLGLLGIFLTLLAIPIWLCKRAISSFSNRLSSGDIENIKQTQQYGYQQQNNLNDNNDVTQASKLNNTSWHKSFQNGDIDIGLRFHYPNKQAQNNYHPDRFLVFVRTRGNRGQQLYNKIINSVSGIKGIWSELESSAIQYGGPQIRPALQLVDTAVDVVDRLITPLMYLGNLSTSTLTRVISIITRYLIGNSYDPTHELQEVLPNYHITDSKHLWIPTQGTLHIITLQTNDKSKINTNQGIIYEISFDFPPNKVKGASELINPNISVEDKAVKAVRLMVESIVTVPFASPIAGRITEAILSEIVAKKKPQ